jgi:hypothetical protein
MIFMLRPFCVFYLFVISLFSCSGNGVKEYFQNAPIRYPSLNKMYARDSLYLAYTIYEFRKLNVVGYGYDFQRVDIDTIAYSPDTLKFFSLVIDYTKESDALNYDGHAILGYRLKTTDPWIVYPILYSVFLDYQNYNMVRDRLRKAYFQDFGVPVSGIWNYRTKEFETCPSYNVIDHRFWDSSFIWQKNVSIPGYYTFQLSGNGDPEMPHPVIEIPSLHYPDSLLKLYHENKW